MTSGPSLVELDLSAIGNFFKRNNPPESAMERDAAGLPYTDKEHIQFLQHEYEAAAVHGGQEAVEKCFK